MQERIRKLSNNAESLRWQIAFVVICVVVSRLLILVGFEVWKERTAFEGNFFEAFSRFDTTWYQSIIGSGYQTEPTLGDRHDAANWAFFPLFPMMIRCLHFFIPVEYDLLGFLVNSVLFGGALLLAFRYILFTRGDKVQAVVFVLLLSFGMYNFYFSTLYTEALFLFLLVLFFYSMEKKKYICMGVAGALASATRNMGIMCVFAVAAHYLTEYMKNNKFRIKTLITNLFSNPPLVLGTVLIPAGLFSYMLYLYCLTGDSMAFVHIQRAWGRGDMQNPFRVMLNSLTNVDSFVFYLALFSVWGIYCVWLLICEKRWAEAEKYIGTSGL